MKCSPPVLLLLLACHAFSYGQQINGVNFQKEYQLHISRAKSPVLIDGNLNEAAWAAAGIASDFWRKYPNDLGKATRKTEVRIMFDDNFLYFGFTAFDSGKVVGYWS